MARSGVHSHIEQLVEDERALRLLENQGVTDPDATAATRARLQSIGAELDRCHEVLRQREAPEPPAGVPDFVDCRAAGIDGFLV